jgi:hypothetical protein
MLPQNRADLEQRSALLSLDLKSFANQIQAYEAQDPRQNDWTKDKKVGPLVETTVNSQKAYQFTLTKSFGGPFGGYALAGDKTYMFVVTENTLGDKFILHYVSENPVSKSIFQSFRFVQ